MAALPPPATRARIRFAVTVSAETYDALCRRALARDESVNQVVAAVLERFAEHIKARRLEQR
jgi:predicted HicB family RNase H-like nuclease